MLWDTVGSCPFCWNAPESENFQPHQHLKPSNSCGKNLEITQPKKTWRQKLMHPTNFHLKHVLRAVNFFETQNVNGIHRCMQCRVLYKVKVTWGNLWVFKTELNLVCSALLMKTVCQRVRWPKFSLYFFPSRPLCTMICGRGRVSQAPKTLNDLLRATWLQIIRISTWRSHPPNNSIVVCCWTAPLPHCFCSLFPESCLVRSW